MFKTKRNFFVQECSIKERAKFTGRYNDRECGITIKSAKPEDSGTYKENSIKRSLGGTGSLG